MTPSRILLLLLLAKLALVVACGGDSRQAADASPSLSETATAIVSATVGPSAATLAIPVQRIPIRWTPSPTPLDVAGATEPADPWAAEREQRLKGGLAEIGQTEWAVYVVEGNAEPRQVLASKRWLDGLTWDKDGLRSGFLTKRVASSSELSRSVDFSWRGSMTIDPSAGRSTTQLEPFPQGIATLVQSSNRTVSVERDATRANLLVTFGTTPSRPGQPGQLPPGPPSAGPPGQPTLDAVYVLDAKGAARKLEGISGFLSPQWVHNGKTIVGRNNQASEAYFIPLAGGDALRLEGVKAISIERRVTDTPEPRVEGSRVAVALATTAPDEVELALYDSNSHSLRSVGRTSAANIQGMYWLSSQPDKVATVDRLIDINTGQSSPIPPPEQLYPAPASRTPTSPSGRYVVRMPEIKLGQYQTTPECRGLPYKVDIEDKQASTTRTLFECQGGSMGSARWLGEERLLVSVSPCIGGCDANESRSLIIEVATGKVIPLHETFEPNVFLALSPDGSKILTGGKALRVYSSAGALLRRLDPPPGFDLASGVWSPDGASFAFILGPKNWVMGP